MAATQVQGKAAQEKAQEKARAMSISTNDPKFNTPLIPASTATFIVHATTRVDAPASLVFRTLRNTDTWRDWNNFVPRVTIRSQPGPEDDRVTEAEIADLVLNTSRLGSVDSDITDGAATPPPPKKETGFLPPPAASSTDASRRASVASGKSNDGLSGAERYAQAQAQRRWSAVSGLPNSPEEAAAMADVARPASPAPQPAKLIETSSPSQGGVLIHHGTNTARNGRGAVSKDARRRAGLMAMYGEPSIRLKAGTRMTFHTRMGLPLNPGGYKDVVLVVNEVSRPDDLQNDDPNSGLTRSKTHTLSRSGVYRIVWGTDHKADARPKFLLTSQWVFEARPIMRGDGKEECEVRIWEGMKGISASGIKKQYQGYLFERFQDWVLGLRDYCEAMGGAVERRDFIKEH